MFLEEVLSDLLDGVPLDIRRRMWFQLDGAPAHFAVDVRHYIYIYIYIYIYLDLQFPNRWIGRHDPVSWPVQSPDLTPLDFYLWGHMKSHINETPVESEEDITARIAVAAGVFGNVRDSLRRRCRTCINVHGRHFEHI